MDQLTLRAAVPQVLGLRYVYEHLQVHSGPGQKALEAISWLSAPAAIQAELDAVARVLAHLAGPTPLRLDLVQMSLCQVQDLGGTLEFLRSGTVRDDVELFEVKSFILLALQIRELLESVNFPEVRVPDLTAPLAELDPEGKRIPQFHIYDEYSPALRQARRELVMLQRQQASDDAQEAKRLECLSLENEARKALCQRLKPYVDSLAEAQQQVGRLDLLLAKALLAQNLHLCKPSLSSSETELKDLVHPEIADTLARKHQAFQPVCVALYPGVTLITGANMAGKSVVLQSVSLAQHMLQFGLYVAASAAKMVPVERVMTSFGDGQNHLEGLSSFGSEILRVDAIARAVLGGRKLLVLVDELARTTNPIEGRAIVCGVVHFLQEYNVMALVTTHYSGIDVPCRRLKVRGFQHDRVEGALGIESIGRYIDYTLEPDESGQVPHEGLRIAQLLGLHTQLLEDCQYFLEHDHAGER